MKSSWQAQTCYGASCALDTQQAFANPTSKWTASTMYLSLGLDSRCSFDLTERPSCGFVVRCMCSLCYSTVHDGTLHMMLHFILTMRPTHCEHRGQGTPSRYRTKPRQKPSCIHSNTCSHMSDHCSRSAHLCYDLCFAMSLSYTKAYDASGSVGLDISVHVKVLVWTKTMIEKHQNCTCSSANVQPCIDRRIAWDPLLRCGLKII